MVSEDFSQFNQRVRNLWRCAACNKSWGAEVVDCTPVPHCSLGQAISHGKKGRGGNHGGWYYGTLLLRSGVITGWMTGLANIDDRWMTGAVE